MLSERQWRNIEVHVDGCWEAVRCLNHDGYARMLIGGRGGRTHYVHRYLYEQYYGPIPDGMELDHLCRNRACVRPDHMEPVTHAENVARGTTGIVNRSKTQCPQGHPYDDANTYLYRGSRNCKTCLGMRVVREAVTT